MALQLPPATTPPQRRRMAANRAPHRRSDPSCPSPSRTSRRCAGACRRAAAARYRGCAEAPRQRRLRAPLPPPLRRRRPHRALHLRIWCPTVCVAASCAPCVRRSALRRRRCRSSTAPRQRPRQRLHAGPRPRLAHQPVFSPCDVYVASLRPHFPEVRGPRAADCVWTVQVGDRVPVCRPEAASIRDDVTIFGTAHIVATRAGCVALAARCISCAGAAQSLSVRGA